jgi:hypothetical protein
MPKDEIYTNNACIEDNLEEFGVGGIHNAVLSIWISPAELQCPISSTFVRCETPAILRKPFPVPSLNIASKNLTANPCGRVI